MNIREAIDAYLEEHPDGGPSTQGAATAIADAHGFNMQSVRRAMQRRGAVAAKGVEEERDAYTFDADEQVYHVQLAKLASFNLHADDVAELVARYVNAAGKYTQRQLARWTCKRDGVSLSHRAIKRLLRVLGVDKQAAPLAPHELKDGDPDEMAETWQTRAEAAVEERVEAQAAEKWRAAYERERKRAGGLEAYVDRVAERMTALAPMAKPPEPRPVGCAPVVWLVCASDWHFGARHEGYDLATAKARVTEYTRRLLSRPPPDRIELLVLGDMVDGVIELRDGHRLEQDTYGEDQAAEAAAAIAGLTNALSSFAPVHVRTIRGNHGRVAKDRKSDPERFAEAMTYRLAEAWAPSAEWTHYRGLVGVFEVLSTRVVILHGDRTPKDVRKLALARGYHAGETLIVAGHTHAHRVEHSGEATSVVCGTPKGADPFAKDGLGLGSMPSQALIEVGPEGVGSIEAIRVT